MAKPITTYPHEHVIKLGRLIRGDEATITEYFKLLAGVDKSKDPGPFIKSPPLTDRVEGGEWWHQCSIARRRFYFPTAVFDKCSECGDRRPAYTRPVDERRVEIYGDRFKYFNERGEVAFARTLCSVGGTKIDGVFVWVSASDVRDGREYISIDGTQVLLRGSGYLRIGTARLPRKPNPSIDGFYVRQATVDERPELPIAGKGRWAHVCEYADDQIVILSGATYFCKQCRKGRFEPGSVVVDRQAPPESVDERRVEIYGDRCKYFNEDGKSIWARSLFQTGGDRSEGVFEWIHEEKLRNDQEYVAIKGRYVWFRRNIHTLVGTGSFAGNGSPSIDGFYAKV